MTKEERENALHCLKAMIEEEVCEECKLYGTTGTDHCEADCVRVAIEALKKEPRKGHWIEHEKSISTAFKHLRECSCCKCYFDWLMPRNSFCPNCGADMREGKE